jgi:hypothetical protein
METVHINFNATTRRYIPEDFKPLILDEAARTSETSFDNYFTRQYIPEDNSEL